MCKDAKQIFLFYKHKEEKQKYFFYIYKNGKQYNLTPPAHVSDLTTPGILNDITDRLPT